MGKITSRICVVRPYAATVPKGTCKICIGIKSTPGTCIRVHLKLHPLFLYLFTELNDQFFLDPYQSVLLCIVLPYNAVRTYTVSLHVLFAAVQLLMPFFAMQALTA